MKRATLDDVLDVIRAGGAVVCSRSVHDRIVAGLPADVRAGAADRVIAHPWLSDGELWAVSPGATIVRPMPGGEVAT